MCQTLLVFQLCIQLVQDQCTLVPSPIGKENNRKKTEKKTGETQIEKESGRGRRNDRERAKEREREGGGR